MRARMHAKTIVCRCNDVCACVCVCVCVCVPGIVGREDMAVMLRQLTGSHLTEDELNDLVTRAMEEAGVCVSVCVCTSYKTHTLHSTARS